MFELIQLKPNAPKLLRFEREGIEIIVIENIHDIQMHDISKYDAVLIQTLRRREAIEILRELRTSSNLITALRPVLISSSIAGNHRISYLFDGTYSEAEYALRIQLIKQINHRIRHLKNVVQISDYDSSIIQRTIQYCYTREKTLAPRLNRNSSIGFSFPFLSSLIEEEHSIKIVQILDRFTKVGYFSKEVVEHIHGCKKCSGGYLNYRETCPNCASRDLITNDLIHHFSCAHIAPESDFKSEDGLECPKCEKNLRHIGIDYDKPAAVYTCNSCDNEFQNAKIKALCVDCGCDNDLYHLTSYSICEYELTSMGEHAARHGILEVHDKKTMQKSRVVSIQIFEMFRKQEIKRLVNSNNLSWEGSIKLNSELIKHFNDDQKQLIREEVLQIISEYLHETDLLTSASPCWYRFILFDKEPELVQKIGDLVKNNVTILLTEGLNDDTHDVELLITSLKVEK